MDWIKEWVTEMVSYRPNRSLAETQKINQELRQQFKNGTETRSLGSSRMNPTTNGPNALHTANMTKCSPFYPFLSSTTTTTQSTNAKKHIPMALKSIMKDIPFSECTDPKTNTKLPYKSTVNGSSISRTKSAPARLYGMVS